MTPDHELSRRAFMGASAALGLGALTTSPFSNGSGIETGEMPLRPHVYAPLPLGSVQARGWVLKQLQLQRDGLTGHAETVLPATGPNSAWKGGDGEDWEKGPYYVKGLIPLAFTLGDEELIARAKAWVDPILASQRSDGFFGPKTNNDWWPRMVVTYLLRDWHEATSDDRVLTFLSRYYRHMFEHLPKRPISSWATARAGDEIDTIFWLYSRRPEGYLLELADLLKEQAIPWTEIAHENSYLDYWDAVHPVHNVNVPQGLKLSPVYSRRSGSDRDATAYRAAVRNLMHDHGTPLGLWAGSERLCGRSSIAGIETCSIVEYMLSAETVLQTLGDPQIGDELEFVAFNALPAALSKDLHQHVYYTLPNNIAGVQGEVGVQDDHGDDRVVAPRSGFPCCCYNLHMGWPKLVQNSWAVAADGGLAALALIPSRIQHGEVAIECRTQYPFEESLIYTFEKAPEAEFSLHLRVPGWTGGKAQVRINGESFRTVEAGKFAVLRRRWKAGDKVELRLPMSVRVSEEVGGMVSFSHGPLLYALPLKEKWSELTPEKLREGAPGFASYELTSDTPWNYAVAISDAPKDVHELKADDVEFTRHGLADAQMNPFASGAVTCSLQVPARAYDAWTARFDGRLALDPPRPREMVGTPLGKIALVPFGSTMLRIGLFPTDHAASKGESWSEMFEHLEDDGWEKRWLVYRGAKVESGAMHLPHSSIAMATNSEFRDGEYRASISVGEKGNAGVIFRAREASVGADHYRGYYVGLSAERQELVIGRSDNRWIPLASAPMRVQAGESYELVIRAEGERISVAQAASDRPLAEVRDATYRSGQVGCRSYADRARFSKLSIRPLP